MSNTAYLIQELIWELSEIICKVSSIKWSLHMFNWLPLWLAQTPEDASDPRPSTAILDQPLLFIDTIVLSVQKTPLGNVPFSILTLWFACMFWLIGPKRGIYWNQCLSLGFRTWDRKEQISDCRWWQSWHKGRKELIPRFYPPSVESGPEKRSRDRLGERVSPWAQLPPAFSCFLETSNYNPSSLTMSLRSLHILAQIWLLSHTPLGILKQYFSQPFKMHIILVY